jgi:hypothetical protein
LDFNWEQWEEAEKESSLGGKRKPSKSCRMANLRNIKIQVWWCMPIIPVLRRLREH